ncbi:hypothetical protein [Longimicrobium sp.]|uniref:hypothetical protein n=1 Tax=Longimicrobium sp. TaxID=2029185 RepID=UPI003B3B8B9F
MAILRGTAWYPPGGPLRVEMAERGQEKEVVQHALQQFLSEAVRSAANGVDRELVWERLDPAERSVTRHRHPFPQPLPWELTLEGGSAMSVRLVLEGVEARDCPVLKGDVAIGDTEAGRFRAGAHTSEPKRSWSYTLDEQGAYGIEARWMLDELPAWWMETLVLNGHEVRWRFEEIGVEVTLRRSGVAGLTFTGREPLAPGAVRPDRASVELTDPVRVGAPPPSLAAELPVRFLCARVGDRFVPSVTAAEAGLPACLYAAVPRDAALPDRIVAAGATTLTAELLSEHETHLPPVRLAYRARWWRLSGDAGEGIPPVAWRDLPWPDYEFRLAAGVPAVQLVQTRARALEWREETVGADADDHHLAMVRPVWRSANGSVEAASPTDAPRGAVADDALTVGDEKDDGSTVARRGLYLEPLERGDDGARSTWILRDDRGTEVAARVLAPVGGHVWWDPERVWRHEHSDSPVPAQWAAGGEPLLVVQPARPGLRSAPWGAFCVHGASPPGEGEARVLRRGAESPSHALTAGSENDARLYLDLFGENACWLYLRGFLAAVRVGVVTMASHDGGRQRDAVFLVRPLSLAGPRSLLQQALCPVHVREGAVDTVELRRGAWRYDLVLGAAAFRPPEAPLRPAKGTEVRWADVASPAAGGNGTGGGMPSGPETYGHTLRQESPASLPSDTLRLSISSSEWAGAEGLLVEVVKGKPFLHGFFGDLATGLYLGSVRVGETLREVRLTQRPLALFSIVPATDSDWTGPAPAPLRSVSLRDELREWDERGTPLSGLPAPLGGYPALRRGSELRVLDPGEEQLVELPPAARLFFPPAP